MFVCHGTPPCDVLTSAQLLDMVVGKGCVTPPLHTDIARQQQYLSSTPSADTISDNQNYCRKRVLCDVYLWCCRMSRTCSGKIHPRRSLCYPEYLVAMVRGGRMLVVLLLAIYPRFHLVSNTRQTSDRFARERPHSRNNKCNMIFGIGRDLSD